MQKSKKKLIAISAIILIAILIISVCFLTKLCKKTYLKNYYGIVEISKGEYAPWREYDRLVIVHDIISGELTPNDRLGNINLPLYQRKLSDSGQIRVLKNDNEGTLIVFWIFRGLLSGSRKLMYSTGGEQLIRENESHEIIEIIYIKNRWYYVETSY